MNKLGGLVVCIGLVVLVWYAVKHTTQADSDEKPHWTSEDDAAYKAEVEKYRGNGGVKAKR